MTKRRREGTLPLHVAASVAPLPAAPRTNPVAGANLVSLLDSAIAIVSNTTPSSFGPHLAHLLPRALAIATTCRCQKVAQETRTSLQWRRLLGRPPREQNKCDTPGCCYGDVYGKDTLVTVGAWDRGKEHQGRCERRPRAGTWWTHDDVFKPPPTAAASVAASTATATPSVGDTPSPPVVVAGNDCREACAPPRVHPGASTRPGVIGDTPISRTVFDGNPLQVAAGCAVELVALAGGPDSQKASFDLLLVESIKQVPQTQALVRKYLVAARKRSRLCRCARVASPVYTSHQWVKLHSGGDRNAIQAVVPCPTIGCPAGSAYSRDVYITHDAWRRGKEHCSTCPRAKRPH